MKGEPVCLKKATRGLITDCAMSSWNAPSDGGHDVLSAVNATGVDTLMAPSRPRPASAACTFLMAGTSCWVRSLAMSNTSFPTAMPLMSVVG